MSATTAVVPNIPRSSTAAAVPRRPISVALLATVVTSVALGTNLWNLNEGPAVYCASVCAVVSIKIPKPLLNVVLPQPVIVAALEWLVKVPEGIVHVPLLGVYVALNSFIDIIVPTLSAVVAFAASGWAAGIAASLSNATKPPTSSIKSTIRLSIANVVAIYASSADQVSPDLISSPLSILKYLASEAEVV